MEARAEAKKQQVLHELSEARASILEAARALPPQKRYQVFLGEWSAADLLAHLIGWDHANLRAAEELLGAKMPSFYAYQDRDWRSYNAQLVATYKRGDWGELLMALEESHRRLLDYVTTIPGSEFVKDRGVRAKGWKVTIEWLLKVEASDEREHAQQLRRFLEA